MKLVFIILFGAFLIVMLFCIMLVLILGADCITDMLFDMSLPEFIAEKLKKKEVDDGKL